MRASLYNLSLIQDNDLIAVADGGKTVGDHDAGNAAFADGADDIILCLCIQGRGGLIHDADGGILGQGTGDLQSLTLTA